jgi:peptidyl-prolyl cis-trans isomerase SurA
MAYVHERCHGFAFPAPLLFLVYRPILRETVKVYVKYFTEFYMRFLVLAAFAMIFAVSPAAAQARPEGIAAVVNADIITTTDLKDRAEMLIKSSGQPFKPEMVTRVQNQVLEGLIAETVQLQETRRQGINVTDEEVAEGFKKIAVSNKMEPEQFKALLKRTGVRVSSIERQIKSQIGWGKVIQQVLRARVIVGDSEIAAERARMKESSGKKEFYTAEIFLPVSTAADDAKVRALAMTLADQIRKGAPFPDIARQHSQSASAAQGGMIGWVQEGQLEPALNAALMTLQKDKVSDPVKGADGYYLLFVRNVHDQTIASPDDAVLSLRELVIDTTGMTEHAASAEAEAITKDLSGCLDIAKKAASDKRYKLSERQMAISELSPAEKTRLGAMDIGRALKPEYGSNRAVITMVCARSDPKGALATDAALERKIGIQRLDLLQKRYLRDLIGAAYIERRL